MQQSINVEALQYDRTLVLAIELSSKSWVLAAQVPGLQKTKAKRTIEPDKEALRSVINGYRARAVAAGYQVERVVATYEAGWSGFWLARWLIAQGIEVHVIQPSSVPVADGGWLRFAPGLEDRYRRTPWLKSSGY